MTAVVASQTITFTSASATPTATYPSGIQAGDLIRVRFVATTGATAGTITTPSGYTLLGSVYTGSFDFRTGNYWKVADGSETGTFTITQSTAQNTHITVQRITGAGTFPGAGGSYDVSTAPATGATKDSPAVTTAAANELVLVDISQFADGSAAWGATRPTGTTDNPGTPKLQSNFALSTYAAYFVQASAGSTGAKTWSGLYTNGQISQATTIAVPSAASGAFSLACDSGSFALNGQTAGLLFSKRITAAQGSFALNGQTADLRKGFTSAFVFGSFALTGQTVGLTKTSSMPAAQGSYALNGQTANLLKGSISVHNSGAYALNGQTVTLSSLLGIIADQGLFSLIGSAALVDLVSAMEQGSFALNGQNATLNAGGRLTAAQGAFALTGQVAGLLRALLAAAAQGAFALTGQVIALNKGGTTFAESGSFNFAGYNAGLLYSGAPDTGAYYGGLRIGVGVWVDNP